MLGWNIDATHGSLPACFPQNKHQLCIGRSCMEQVTASAFNILNCLDS